MNLFAIISLYAFILSKISLLYDIQYFVRNPRRSAPVIFDYVPIRTKMSITSILQMKHVGLCTRPIFSQSLRLRVPAFCIGAIMVLCLIAIV